MLRENILQNMDLFKEKNAISYNGKEITYLELKREAISIANYLVNNKSCCNNCGVFFSHGDLGIAGIIGCLFAGITYVPIDEEQTSENIKYMLNNSNINIIITDKVGIEKLVEKGIEKNSNLCIIDIEEILFRSKNQEDFFPFINKNSIIYHLYTSGSTGRPKAVEQTEENIYYFANAYTDMISLLYSDNMTLFSTFGHDATVIDIYACLLTGACLYPRDLRNIKNIITLPNWLKENNITIWHSVPSFYRKFFNNYGKKCTGHVLRRIILGGEAVRKNDFIIFNKIEHAENIEFYNLYGQTESSYTAGKWIKREVDCELFGEPVPGTSIIVKGCNGNLTVLGEKLNENDLAKISDPKIMISEGEIVIVSRYIAKGYLNEPELTNTVFFNIDSEKSIYKTGDYVDVIVDGGFRFSGRKDSQCKINGYRVELGIIEDELLKLDDVEDCVVYPKECKGQIRIHGALKTKFHHDLQDVNLFLKDKVPQHMLLYSVKCFEEFPMTVTGKTNRKEIEQDF